MNLSNATPDAIVLHPSDWATIAAGKATGSGEYLSGGPFGASPTTLWGVATIASTVMPGARSWWATGPTA